MISGIKGKIFKKSYNSVEIDVNGLIYKVFIPLRLFSSLPQKGEEVFLFTTNVIGENENSLYGFESEDERELFSKIISIMGVGPKTALNIFSKLSYEEIVRVIEDGDEKILKSIPGIGKKSAGRIILELSGKLIVKEKLDTLNEDILDALINLGYKRKEAEDALYKAKNNTKTSNEEELLKEALKILYENKK